jgi:hypothetical protein
MKINPSDMLYALKLRAESIDSPRSRSLALASLDGLNESQIRERYLSMIEADNESNETKEETL